MSLQRLQKILAQAGLGSRRHCESLITAGRVTVDGRVVTELGSKADPDRQEIRCDGERVRPERKVYYLVNKPKNYLCTNRVLEGKRRVVDLLHHVPERLYTVGRLDADTEGLLILTNDGEFAQIISHPRHGVTKTYVARVSGRVGPEVIKRMLAGVWVGGFVAKAVAARVLQAGSRSTLEIVMRQGHKREIRRMLAKLGHPVEHLQRVAIGDLRDPNLPVGSFRPLLPREIEALLSQAKSYPQQGTQGRKGESPNAHRPSRILYPSR